MDNSDKLLDLAVAGGIGYVGHEAYRKINLPPIMGALTGLIGYKLARSDNLASGTAGVATLTALGLMHVPTEGALPPEKQQECYDKCKPLLPNPAVMLLHPTLYQVQLTAFNNCMQRCGGLIP